MKRVGKRLNVRRASPGMAFALAQRCNTAGSRFPARSRTLATEGKRPPLGLWDALHTQVLPALRTNPSGQSAVLSLPFRFYACIQNDLNFVIVIAATFLAVVVD